MSCIESRNWNLGTIRTRIRDKKKGKGSRRWNTTHFIPEFTLNKTEKDFFKKKNPKNETVKQTKSSYSPSKLC